jgi:arsenite oxidase small subunit
LSQGDPTEPKKEDNEEESRRGFLRSALALATVLVIAGIGAVTKSLWTPTPAPTGSFPNIKVANVSDLQVNNYATFDYPLVGESNMIVKLGVQAEGGVGPDGDIVAFSIVCQHLGCTVGYRATSPGAPGPVGACPCHGSIYDLVDGGKVLSGPAPRNIPQVTLQLDESTGDIYAVGMGPPTIFGHDTGSTDVSYDLQGGTPVSSS